MGKLKKILFIVSIVVNLCFLLTWINQPLSRYGVLASVITLPKGLVVINFYFDRLFLFEDSKLFLNFIKDYGN